jgi:hypothetical protein
MRWRAATTACIVTFLATCAAFHVPGRTQCRNLRTALHDANDPLAALEARLKNSPGYVASTPISAADRSRLELAKVVVSTAVFLLSVQIKIKELTSQFNKDAAADSTSSTTTGSPMLLPNGIQYTDAVPAVASAPLSFPADGDEVVVVAKLFYNGLQVNKNAPTEALAFVCRRGSVVPADATATWFEPRMTALMTDGDGRVPLTGIAAALAGLAYGTQRKAVLPSSLAFGSTGLPPYVPPGASVLCELTMTKKV